jgi:hypothetical protein
MYRLNPVITKTGFEFKKQRAIPVLTGIAVAEEFENLVLEVSLVAIPVLRDPKLES